MTPDWRTQLRPRPLSADERQHLLALEHPARLATIDSHGFPHITPIWFLWDAEAFVMTCLPDRPHVRRLHANPAACVCVDVEDPERQDGQRPNRQVRAIGNATIETDIDGAWTRRITNKYVHGPSAQEHADRRASHTRVLIRLVPDKLVAVASV